MSDPVNPLSQLLSGDSLTRRSLLQRAGLLGLSIPVVSALLAACGDDDDDEPTATSAPADEGTEDEEEEEESPTSPPAVMATSTPLPTKSPDEEEADRPTGGTVRHLIYEDPDTLNFIIGGTSIGRQVYQTIVEGLVYVDPNGDFQPLLAAELPTYENGGISEDNLTVTWKLKEGVTWSDGEPFTSDDVIFTYEAVTQAPESILSDRFAKVESIEAPDDLTVVIKYSETDVGYLEQWRASLGSGIIPRHATGPIDQITRWDWNRKPIGTGPFVLSEWEAGAHVVCVKNENYHMPGKPYIDRIDFLIVPSEDARAQMMLQGDAEIMLWPGETYNQDFEDSPLTVLGLAPGVWNTRLIMNLSKTFDGDPGPEPPHDLLGDLRVRKAISMAINRERIVSEILEDRVLIANGPHEIGWNRSEMPPYEYDPEAAKALMEEAGWVEGPGGVRVAQGAETTEDGTVAEISLVTYTSFLPLELTGLAIQEDLAAIGIKVNFSMEDFAVIFGGWEDGAPRKTGDFDMMLYDTSMGGVEPHSTIFNIWHSSRIPSAEVPGGGNYSRFNNAEADALIEAGGLTLDLDERHANYHAFVEIEREVLPIIYLFQFNEGSAYSARLKGYVVSTWEWSTWDSFDWYFED
jgi:peptide/nickel transport system substrate-binding protein